MYKRVLCIALAVLLLILCGCSKDTGEGKSFVYPIDEPLSYLDPQIVSSPQGRLAVRNCFEGLVRLDTEGKVQPAAAADWEISESGKTYTFRLREGAVWYIPKAVELYDRQEREETVRDEPVLEVTAYDFVFAFRRAVSPDTGSEYSHILSSVKNAESVIKGKKKISELGVAAEDKYTLKITLTSADSDFLYKLTSPVCMPCNEEFFNKTGGRYGISDEYMIYNGPFYISSWSDDSSATLKPNEKYTGPFKAKPASVYLSLNSTQDTRLNKLEDGTYDIAPLTASQVASSGTEGAVRVYSFKNGTKGLVFNCSDSMLKNKELRRSLLLSVDYGELNGGVQVGTVPGVCIASCANYRDLAGEIQYPKHNGKLAIKLWEKALKKLKADSFSFTVLCSEEDENTVRRVMQGWQALFGVSLDVKCEVLEPEEIFRRTRSGNYQAAVTDISSQTEFASDFLMSFTSGDVNNTAVLSDANYDGLMMKAVRASGTEKTVNYLREAEQYLLTNAVFVPIGECEVYYGSAGKVSGICFTASGDISDFSQMVKYD